MFKSASKTSWRSSRQGLSYMSRHAWGMGYRCRRQRAGPGHISHPGAREVGGAAHAGGPAPGHAARRLSRPPPPSPTLLLTSPVTRLLPSQAPPSPPALA